MININHLGTGKASPLESWLLTSPGVVLTAAVALGVTIIRAKRSIYDHFKKAVLKMSL